MIDHNDHEMEDPKESWKIIIDLGTSYDEKTTAVNVV